MDYIDDVAALEAIYGSPGRAAKIKVADHLTPLYRRWVEASRFLILTTVGPEGTDGSPRGDRGPVVTIADDRTLLLPDWHGNNRMDSLRNIVRDGRVSLMFMVPGSSNVVRINGQARVTADPAATGQFETCGKSPRSVIVITLGEVYFQCARAILRSGLWSGRDESEGLPSAGALLSEQETSFDGQDYDATWADRAAQTMW